jgi:aspartate kinase
MTPSVIKFGGSSFATPERYPALAADIAVRARTEPMVVVVSAPPGLTEDWRTRLHAVNAAPSDETIAGLLPRADTVGAYLLRAAFDAIGANSRVLTGPELGIRTDSNFCRARVQDVDTRRIRDTLSRGAIAIVPGGQAVNDDLQLTWLGKNSSDFSAIALAAALGCPRVDIHSDVEGIYSSDPGVVAEAQLLARVSWADAITMSVAGAKVLHHGSVEHARAAGLEIHCRRNRDDYPTGTIVGAGEPIDAVVPDKRSLVLDFADAAGQIAAAAALARIAVPTVTLQPGETGRRRTTLVVTCGFFDAIGFLRGEGVHARETGQKLLTVVERGRPVRSLWADEDLLEAAARFSHERLYGAARRDVSLHDVSAAA